LHYILQTPLKLHVHIAGKFSAFKPESHHPQAMAFWFKGKGERGER